MQNTTPLDQLIAELESIKVADGKSQLRSYSLKCAACIAFTDRFIPEMNSSRSELTEHLGDIRRSAIKLKGQCDKVERNLALKSLNIAAVQEAYREIVGLVENVCLLVNPDLIEKVDAAAL